MMRIDAALKYGTEQLAAMSEPLLEAGALLTHVLQKNRAFLVAHPEKVLTQEQSRLYHQCIAQRAQGIPLAYITQQREFWSLTFGVNEHTLIPRSETELLVELALSLLPSLALDVLDLGTGSGAIALALAQERPQWRISASDVSPEALDMAKKNAKSLNNSSITFYQSHWFSALPPKRYHAIISNPPYLAVQDPHLYDLRFEPLHALVSGAQGLDSLHHIITHSPEHLLPGGLLLIEHGYDQKDALLDKLSKHGYENIKSWQDLQGHDRAITAYMA